MTNKQQLSNLMYKYNLTPDKVIELVRKSPSTIYFWLSPTNKRQPHHVDLYTIEHKCKEGLNNA